MSGKYSIKSKVLNAAWKKTTDLNCEESLEKEEALFEEELKQVNYNIKMLK